MTTPAALDAPEPPGWGLLLLAAFWIVMSAALSLPRLLREVPRGVVAGCESACGLGPPSERGSRQVVARTAVALRDGRVVELERDDVPCECSCDGQLNGPRWCLRAGAFIEKRRWEYDFRTSDGVLEWASLPFVTVCVAVLMLTSAFFWIVAAQPTSTELFRRHPWAVWLSREQLLPLTAAPHVLLLLAVMALVARLVIDPLAYAAAGVAWAGLVGLIRLAFARGGLATLALLAARRAARRHSYGVAAVGRIERGRLVTAGGDVFALEIEAATWLGRRPASLPEGAVVEAVGGVARGIDMAAERLERASVARNVLGPLDGRPLLCRMR